MNVSASKRPGDGQEFLWQNPAGKSLCFLPASSSPLAPGHPEPGDVGDKPGWVAELEVPAPSVPQFLFPASLGSTRLQGLFPRGSLSLFSPFSPQAPRALLSWGSRNCPHGVESCLVQSLRQNCRHLEPSESTGHGEKGPSCSRSFAENIPGRNRDGAGLELSARPAAAQLTWGPAGPGTARAFQA